MLTKQKTTGKLANSKFLNRIMNICIFPGTFNPIHNAHIKMAEFALDKFNFDKIIFIPSYIPPHKNIDKNLAQHRFNMVKLALEKNKHFEISDIEYLSEEKSYSLLTVKKIIELYNIKGKLNFIIGTDAFIKLDTWYKAEELKNLVHFIVFPRHGIGDKKTYEDFYNNGWDFEIVNFLYMDISSTDIRNLQKNDVNKTVKDYIEKNELYKS